MTTDQGSVNAYLRTRVLTASPEELRLMLLDGALKFASQAGEGLRTKNHELAYNGFSQCRAIITELIVSIRPEFDPELFGKVRALYTFMFTRLVDANRERSLEKLEEVVQLLTYERETWAMLMDKLQIDRQRSSEARITEPTPGQGTSSASSNQPRRATISVEG
jgi:flagellar secretion chaperone FliS